MAYWRKQTLAQALARSARRFPGQEALVIDGQRLTYSALRDSVNRVAAGLQALGIRRGDHVAVCLANSLEWVQFFYGAATIGAVTVPVNTRFKDEELRYCLKQSDARLLLVADRFLKIDFIEMLKGICPAVNRQLPGRDLPALEHVVVLGHNVPKAAIRWQTLLSLGGKGRGFKSPPVTPDDVLLMQYTSGTTSYPKGAMLTHDNMLRNATGVCPRFDLRAGDRYYSARVFYHVAGTTLSLLAGLVTGACLISSGHFEPGAALRLMSEEECTHTSGNDTTLLMMLNHPDLDRYPLKLRGGWASAGPEVSRRAIERLGMKGLSQAYGLSETSPNVCMSRHDDDLDKRINGWAHLLDGVKVRIVDPQTGKDVPPGKTGENVAPSEVEEVLHRHPAIRQAQVIGVPDPRLLEVPAAYVILKQGEAATTEQIIAWSRERMASFRVPRYVRIVDSFDTIGMTGSAKVQKGKLRAQALIDFNLQNNAANAA